MVAQRTKKVVRLLVDFGAVVVRMIRVREAVFAADGATLGPPETWLSASTLCPHVQVGSAGAL